MADGRVTQAVVEVVSRPNAAARVTQHAVETLSRPFAAARVSQFAVEILSGAVIVVTATPTTQAFVWGPL